MAQIAFDPDKHRYTIDGTEVPSVTQICRIEVEIEEALPTPKGG